MPSMWARVLVAWALEEVIDRHDLRRALRRAKRGEKLPYAVDWNSAGARLLDKSPDSFMHMPFPFLASSLMLLDSHLALKLD